MLLVGARARDDDGRDRDRDRGHSNLPRGRGSATYLTRILGMPAVIRVSLK